MSWLNMDFWRSLEWKTGHEDRRDSTGFAGSPVTTNLPAKIGSNGRKTAPFSRFRSTKTGSGKIKQRPHSFGSSNPTHSGRCIFENAETMTYRAPKTPNDPTHSGEFILPSLYLFSGAVLRPEIMEFRGMECERSSTVRKNAQHSGNCAA